MRRAHLAAALACAGCAGAGPRLPPGDYTPRDRLPALVLPPAQLEAARRDALQRARVWQEPPVPVAQADLGGEPPGPDALPRESEVVCRFQYRSSPGYSPKFHCVRPGGDVLKVKYGWNSREVRTEVASTRLLAALGFGADRMYVVERVRCFGCPPYPYEKLAWLGMLRVDYREYRDFDFVSVERPLGGAELETATVRGWRWDELAQIDPARGGSTRDEVDALRLMAVFLSNWDSKDSNQRLVCLPGPSADPSSAPAPCPRPFAYMHDVGTTFGPHSMNVREWSARPVWTDAARCLVSMKGLPYDGATFGDTRISEGGRRFLAEKLAALSPPQIEELFRSARFPEFPWKNEEDGDLGRWVAAFQDRVRQIADRPACPDA